MQIMSEGTVREETKRQCTSRTALHRRHGDIFGESLCSHLWKFIILNVTIESLVLRSFDHTDISRALNVAFSFPAFHSLLLLVFSSAIEEQLVTKNSFEKLGMVRCANMPVAQARKPKFGPPEFT